MDSGGLVPAKPVKGEFLITCADLYHFKFTLAELVAVIVLFFASLSSGVQMQAVIDLSIFIMVMSVVLLLSDLWFLAKTRDFRRVVLALFVLECIIFVSSAVVLSFWVDYENDDDLVGRDRSLSLFYGLDAVMLVSAVLVTLGRLVVRAKDRQKKQAEDDDAQSASVDQGISI